MERSAGNPRGVPGALPRLVCEQYQHALIPPARSRIPKGVAMRAFGDVPDVSSATSRQPEQAIVRAHGCMFAAGDRGGTQSLLDPCGAFVESEGGDDEMVELHYFSSVIPSSAITLLTAGRWMTRSISAV